MPLKIIRDDLLNIKCEAIVNPTDTFLSGSGGIDKRVHKACGSLLKLELEKTYSLEVSKAIITKSYNLKTCKYIIHTVGPIYVDGNNDEFNKLRECYKNILDIAKKNKFKSIAIPLISTGTYNFPKKEAYLIALEEINNFLIDNDLKIYLVIYDNESFSISKKLSNDVKAYIDDNYVIEHRSYRSRAKGCIDTFLNNDDFGTYAAGIFVEDEISFKLDESFSDAILRIIREKDLNEVDIYKKAGIDRKLFSKLRSNKNYVPSKKTAISLCIALKLDLEETNEILKKAGLALSHSNLFDVIIEYFIKNNNYDLYDINVVLLENDQELLGC